MVNNKHPLEGSAFDATFRVVRFLFGPNSDGWTLAIVRLTSAEPKQVAEAVEKAAMDEMWGETCKYHRGKKRPWFGADARPKESYEEDMGIIYKGCLGSAAPYMWHSGTFVAARNEYKGTKRWEMQPVVGSTVFCVKPESITLSHVYWILTNETDCGSKEAAQALLKENMDSGVIRTSKAGERLYVDLDEFQQEPFYRDVFKHSDLYRMQYQTAAIHVFGKELAVAIKEKKPHVLERLYKVMSTEPWTLCFYENCERQFRGLGELDWLGFRRAMVHFKLPELPTHMEVGLRVYSVTINEWRSMTNNTLFDMQEMKRFHVDVQGRVKDWRTNKDLVPVLLAYGEGDGRHLDDAFQWLTGREADAIHEYPDGTAALKKDRFMARKIVKWLGEIATNENLPELRPGNAVPCRPRGELDEEQREAMRRLILGYPLVMVSGAPGTGKTGVIEAALARFLNVGVFCAHGTMTRELARRFSGGGDEGTDCRSGIAFTIDHMDTLHHFTPSARKWMQRLELLIVDEASNLNLDHLYKLLRVTRRAPGEPRTMGARQLLLVFDHNQQRPIGPGEPVMALTDVFPDLLVHLQTQHRTEDAGVAISQAAITMLNPRAGPTCVDFARLELPGNLQGHFMGALHKALRNPLVHLDSEVCGRFCSTKVTRDPRDVCQPHVLPTLIQYMARQAGGIENWREWQFIAMRKADSDRIGLAVLQYLRAGPMRSARFITVPRSGTEHYMPRGLMLAPGVKIVFRKTFKGEWNRVTKKREWPEVRNGQICVIQSVDEDGKHAMLDDGRRICFDPRRHVDPRYVRYAYCITSYSAQGLGCRAVCVVLHEETRNATWPARDSVYTALTRAKRLAVVYGRLRDFVTFSRRIPARRSTVLRKLMLENVALNNVLHMRTGGRQQRPDPPEIRNPSDLWVVPQGAQCTVSMADAIADKPFVWKWGDIAEPEEEKEEEQEPKSPPQLPVLSRRKPFNHPKRRAVVNVFIDAEAGGGDDDDDDDDGEEDGGFIEADAYDYEDGFVVPDDVDDDVVSSEDWGASSPMSVEIFDDGGE